MAVEAEPGAGGGGGGGSAGQKGNGDGDADEEAANTTSTTDDQKYQSSSTSSKSNSNSGWGDATIADHNATVPLSLSSLQQKKRPPFEILNPYKLQEMQNEILREIQDSLDMENTEDIAAMWYVVLVAVHFYRCECQCKCASRGDHPTGNRLCVLCVSVLVSICATD